MMPRENAPFTICRDGLDKRVSATAAVLTAATFRAIALALPETTEVEHLGHPDFRRGGKIFATLGYPDADWGMVKLAPEEQAVLVAAQPQTFVPSAGAWGRAGSTLVRLAAADENDVVAAMELAWDRAGMKPARSVRRRRT